MTLFATIAMVYARQNDNKSAALFLAIMILLLAAGFLVGVWTRRRLARRQKDLAAWAAQKGLRFGPDKAFGLDML